MTEFQSSYRQILKSTSLFGGVQVFQILIALVNSKFVAVLLGPAGMGIAGLINSSISFIQVLTNFGLGTSAIKNLSAAHAAGDENRINVVGNIIRKLVWVSGLLGMLVTLVFSRTLSRITFGNYDYTYSFVLVSVVLLFSQLALGRNVILQGLRKLNLLAKASLIGSLIGLFVSIPIYYIWGIKGIVPAIIISSILSFANAYYYSSKVNIPKVKVNKEILFSEGKSMASLGFVLSMGGLTNLGSAYILRIFISNQGGVTEVGLFAAGFAIINTYVGMILNSMATDYFPRLSGVANSNKQSMVMVNQQAEIALLVLAPILAFFLVFINSIILILFSSKFVAVTGMVQWASLGMYFKALAWAIGYLIIAKGAAKMYFWNELSANVYILFFNILGYKYWGLNGLGISFLLGNIIYLVQVFFLVNRKFAFHMERNLVLLFLIQFPIGAICLIIINVVKNPFNQILTFPLIAISFFYSYKELNRLIDLKSVLVSVKNKLKG